MMLELNIVRYCDRFKKPTMLFVRNFQIILAINIEIIDRIKFLKIQKA